MKIYQIWISLASSLLFLFDVTLKSIQSQPCHWRNIKSVTKRDVSNTTITSELAESEKKEKSVSDNISLFQSLRVLQEGEGEDSYSSSTRSNYIFSSFIFVQSTWFDTWLNNIEQMYCRFKRAKWNVHENKHFVVICIGQSYAIIHPNWIAVDYLLEAEIP